MAYPRLDAPVQLLLDDISTRKEFRTKTLNVKNTFSGFKPEMNLILPGLRLSGAQTFIKNFQNPNTEFQRILIKWQTGVGKSIAAISIGQEFIKQFRIRASLGETNIPSVFFISFTYKHTIQKDMLRYPEFGYVSAMELEELRRLEVVAARAGPASIDAKQLSNYMGMLRRRLSDKSAGGGWQFYGDKEFSNHLFMITQQGINNKFNVQSLYAHNENFEEKIQEAVAAGNVVINLDLLNELRGGCIIVDEIHNVYNIKEKNNYGIAIQYVLDVLGKQAPRAVYMSATPITGSAAEVCDLLNLLVPKEYLPNQKHIKRLDLFSRDDNHQTQISAKSLELISKLTAGRVSFLIDFDTAAYPKRIFVGENFKEIPYLKLTLCDMSALHEKTYNEERASKDETSSGFGVTAYTLFDMVFPNPNSTELGLYSSTNTHDTLLSASTEWRANNGVIIEPSSPIITGAYLKEPELSKYSLKYSQMLAATIDAIKAGPGKIMIYHHRVAMSGALIIGEVLRMNGFADETSAPTETTLCSVCGIIKMKHDDLANAKSHDYLPARFIMANGLMERTAMIRSIENYNALANIKGYNFRVLIGTKIIREGFNFWGIRYQFIMSLPIDYPTLMQVFGRVVRKGSHIDLPEELRNVFIRIFVTKGAEFKKYVDKGQEYLVIQEVERALHKTAVDGFSNYERIKAALAASANAASANAASANIDSIDALHYEPLAVKSEPVKTSTFLAYSFGDAEVTTICAICLVLFKARPVWIYDDLWKAIRSGAVKGVVQYDFDESNFVLALRSLQRPTNSMIVVQRSKYYIYTNLVNNIPRLDIECYLRPQITYPNIRINIGRYVSEEKSIHNWEVVFKEFAAKIVNEKYPELSLISYSGAFHYELLKRMISKSGYIPDEIMEIMNNLYKRFHIAIVASMANSKNYRGAAPSNKKEIIGYSTEMAVVLYDHEKKEWYNESLMSYNIRENTKENEVVIGFYQSTNYYSKFKLRRPMHKLWLNKKKDIRSVDRGAVCDTRSREELMNYLKRLQTFNIKNAPDNESMRFPSTNELCLYIKLYLLRLEEARELNVKWIYLFNENLPVISLES